MKTGYQLNQGVQEIAVFNKEGLLENSMKYANLMLIFNTD